MSACGYGPGRGCGEIDDVPEPEGPPKQLPPVDVYAPPWTREAISVWMFTNGDKRRGFGFNSGLGERVERMKARLLDAGEGFGESWTQQSEAFVGFWSDIFSGDWDAASLSRHYPGTALGQAEQIGGATYTWTKRSLDVAVAATAAAAVLMAVEGITGFRIELHGTHGGRVPPHLQGIRGKPGVGPPDWGKTIWRFPRH